MKRPSTVAVGLSLTLGLACTGSESSRVSSASGSPEKPAGPAAEPTPVVPTGAAPPAPGTEPLSGAGPCPSAPPARPRDALMATPGFDFAAAVTYAKTRPRPISGGTLHVLPDGRTAVVSEPDHDRVVLVDLKARAIRARVAMRPGDDPGRVTVDGQGRVHVALRGGGAVLTLDPVLGTVLDRRLVCAAPRGLAYEAATELIHVACAEGVLVSLPARGGPPARSVTLDRDLRDVVVAAKGGLMVSTFRAAGLLRLDATGAVSARQRLPVRSRKGPAGAQSLSPAVAWRTVALPEGGVAVLHQRGLEDAVMPGQAGYVGGRGCEGIIESAVTTINGEGTTAPSVHPGLAMAVLAVDLAVAPNSQAIAVAVAGNGPASGQPQIWTGTLGLVAGGRGDCAFPGQGAAQPMPRIPGQVVAVAYQPDGTLLAQTRGPHGLWFADSGQLLTLADHGEGDDDSVDTGHILFHGNAGGGVACASCHPEAGDDGRVWNFACLGPRRTQSVRGGLRGTEPFHWDGDMSTFSRLVDEVFVGRMGGPTLSGAHQNALLDWLDGVPPLAHPPGDPSAIARGRELFARADVGCSRCHAGPRLTNNTTVDVGTGRRLQVPSLLGLIWRAPYLHDGCAVTLVDRFGPCGGGDKHGLTSLLTSSERADLIVYLGTL